MVPWVFADKPEDSFQITSIKLRVTISVKMKTNYKVVAALRYSKECLFFKVSKKSQGENPRRSSSLVG